MNIVSLFLWRFIQFFVLACFRYMSSTLLRIASEQSSVVAVVGKGHLQGIKKHWKQPVVVGETLPLDKYVILQNHNQFLRMF